MRMIIGHLDMDAFFAAIEERDNPRWRGKPIVVGSDPLGGRGRGVVSTANYKAREYGIRSALPITRAWRYSEAARRRGLEPAIFLTPDFSKYVATSQRVMEILKKYSSQIEEAGIDEAYFDLTGAGSFEKAVEISRAVKKEIKEKENLTASIGLGPNKLIAKIASDQQKPDGLTLVGADDRKICAEIVKAFLEPLPIRKIPGVGPKTEIMFAELGVKTVRDAKRFSVQDLQNLMGKWGIELYQKLRGCDNSELKTEYEAKSIGEQETFEKDTLEPIFIFGRLKFLCTDIFERFQGSDFRNFKTVVLTIRFADFETKSKAHTLKKVEQSLNILEFEAMKLVMPFLDSRANPAKKLIRLIGVRIEKLD